MKNLLLLCIITLISYAILGNHQEIRTYYALQKFDKHLSQLAQAIPQLEQSQAIEALKALPNQTPNTPKAFEKLSTLYSRIGWWEDAKTAAQKALQADPNNPTYALLYIDASYRAGEGKLPFDALVTLESLIEKDPRNTDALHFKALNAFNHGQYKEAKDIWQKLQQQTPKNSELYTSLSEAILSAEQNMVK